VAQIQISELYFKNHMKLKKLVLVLVGLALSACAKDTREYYRTIRVSEIRQAPSTAEVQKFYESTSFNSAKKPNIYFIFFDTLRPDMALSLGKNFKTFFDNNFSFLQAHGSATATMYSMYSLYQSKPPFLAYYDVPINRKNKDEYGSVYLKILKKMGYRINTFGFDWPCVTSEVTTGADQLRFSVFNFGWKSSLLDLCQKEPQYDSVFKTNEDDVTVSELEKKLPTVVTQSEKNFTIINFYNNHDPYLWGALKQSDSLYPLSSEIGPKEDWDNRRFTRNRYTNAVYSSDLNFKKLIDLINTLPGSKDAIIVVFSDHGENLYAKDNNDARHGGVPFREKIRTFLSFRLPDASLQNRNPNDDHFASISDILPTVFEYLAVSPSVPSQWQTGQSLLSSSRSSVLVAQASGEAPTRKMVMVNKSLKAWIDVEEKDFYHASSFKLEKITDTDDKPISSNDHPCLGKSDAECKDILISEFPEAMAELFPSLTNEVAKKLNSSAVKKRILAATPTPTVSHAPQPKVDSKSKGAGVK
jgi:membrane-anchored protein YejM (alkaline phosphatase superfamily)